MMEEQEEDKKQPSEPPKRTEKRTRGEIYDTQEDIGPSMIPESSLPDSHTDSDSNMMGSYPGTRYAPLALGVHDIDATNYKDEEGTEKVRMITKWSPLTIKEYDMADALRYWPATMFEHCKYQEATNWTEKGGIWSQ